MTSRGKDHRGRDQRARKPQLDRGYGFALALCISLSPASLATGRASQPKELARKVLKPLLPSPITPLTHKKFKKLLDDYQFIADFEQKPDRPQGADRRFYRYPIPLKAPSFPLIPLTGTRKELETYFPATRGDGRDIERINRGRNQLRSGRYEQAWRSLRGARELYTGTSPFSRRIDYMLGYTHINRALKVKREYPAVTPLAHQPPPALRKEKSAVEPAQEPGSEQDAKKKKEEESSGSSNDTDTKEAKEVDEDKEDKTSTASGEGGSSASNMAAAAKNNAKTNDELKKAEERRKKAKKAREDYDKSLKRAARALSWAYIHKMNDVDPLVERAGPISYYNLAVLYAMRGNWGEAYTAANTGISFLQRHHDKSFRPELRRMMAEAFLQNRTYWEAVSQLDFALRQDPNLYQAADIFGRAADIYFDLNNFAIAAEIYLLAIRVNQLAGKVDPNHYVLRGEALFWLKRYKEAQIMFQYGLTSQYQPQAPIELRRDLETLASIRMADTTLALGKASAAKQAYFDHIDSYRGTDSATHAKLQLICLELPEAKLGNVRHYHDFLAKHKKPLPESSETFLPPELIEIAHTCETDSFYQRKSGKELIQIVRDFAAKYPKAPALHKYRPKIAASQGKKIHRYFGKGDLAGALAFYEQNRKTLFPKVSKPLAKKLFFAYVAMHSSHRAQPFYRRDFLATKDPQQLLLAAIYLAERSGKTARSAAALRRLVGDQKKIAKKLAQAPQTIAWPEDSPFTVTRLLSGTGLKANGSWLLDHALSSSQNDAQLYCKRVIPLLTKLRSKSPSSIESFGHGRRLREQSARLISEALAGSAGAGSTGASNAEGQGAAESLDTCLAEALAVEKQLNSHRPMAYSQLMLSRKNLPITVETQQIMFALAERVTKLAEQRSFAGKPQQKSGAKKMAQSKVSPNSLSRKLWQWVDQNGNSMQKKLAYFKLNPSITDTVTESLWQSSQSP